jgi:hypothetical protein
MEMNLRVMVFKILLKIFHSYMYKCHIIVLLEEAMPLSCCMCCGIVVPEDSWPHLGVACLTFLCPQ